MSLLRVRFFRAMEVIPCLLTFGYGQRRVLLIVFWSSNAAALLLATFDLRFLNFHEGISSLYFRGTLHESCLVKNLTSAPLLEKEYRPFVCEKMKEERKKKEEKVKLVLRCPSLIFSRRSPLHSNVKSAEVVDVPGMICCPPFGVGQVE